MIEKERERENVEGKVRKIEREKEKKRCEEKISGLLFEHNKENNIIGPSKWYLPKITNLKG